LGIPRFVGRYVGSAGDRAFCHLAYWLRGHALPEVETSEVTRSIRDFATARLPELLGRDCYVGLLSAQGSAGVLRIWLFLSWPGLALSSDQSLSQMREVEREFYESVCRERPRGTTFHLEFVDGAPPTLAIDQGLRKVRREQDCAFHGSFTCQPSHAVVA